MVTGSSLSSVSAFYQPPHRWVPVNKTAAYLRRGFLLSSSSFKILLHLRRLSAPQNLWPDIYSATKGLSFQHVSNGPFRLAFSPSFCFSGRGDSSSYSSENEGMSLFRTSDKSPLNGRTWTNVLLAINVLFYAAQVASDGKLLFWGAKVNSRIAKGELWRLVTSSLLHVNLGHLMVNCYSLNSIGPTVEKLTGPRRFFAVYVVSAVTSSAASYWLSRAPAVGASGAIFGLVGSVAVYILRHRSVMGGGKEQLEYIARVILLNMENANGKCIFRLLGSWFLFYQNAIGMFSKGVDNWGHLGGLFGGVATSWLLGPAWRLESLLGKRRGRLVDRAPIKYLTNTTVRPP